MKPDNLIEDIKSRLNIEDVVSEYVELKRSGQNLKGLCPFHTEKTPSFMVNPSKQIFHCFGCSRGGDMFTFVMLYENITFGEAAETLGRRAGLDLDSYKGTAKKDRGIKDKILAINSEAADFFQSSLQKNSPALEYLKNRGITPETAKEYSLGFTKKEKDSLYKYLGSKGYSDDEIKSSGLVFFGERGPLDFFRNRLIFPITDQQSRTVAFGGRTTQSGSTLPKYINSSDSPVFKKGDTCYGLSQAKNNIAQKGYCIIVEGYFDVIMCGQHGIKNVIAPLGTALTPGHLTRLKRLTNKILLIFDGDAAGISAAKRSLELLFAEAFTSKILLLPKGEDPDTFLRTKGSAAMKRAMSKSISPVDFMLKTTKDKLAAVREMLNILKNCSDQILADETIRLLADKSRINETALREEYSSISSRNSTGSRRHNEPVNSLSNLKAFNAEEELLLNISVGMPGAAEKILAELDLSHIETPIIRSIFDKIKNSAKNGERYFSEDILMRECCPEEQAFVSRHSVSLQIDTDEVDKIIKDCLIKIRLRRLDNAIREAESNEDETLLMKLRVEKTKTLAGQ
ncbi:MAG: DNA primase [Nitrospirae bacterium]|nr:DNA primase [Nitrospirota bacterium]